MEPAADAWDDILRRDGSVVFPTNRARVLKGVAGCAGFALVGLWFIISGSTMVMVLGWLTLVLFTFMGILGLVTFMSGGQTLTVDQRGLMWGQASATWAEIKDVRIFTTQRTRMVIVIQTPETARRNRATLSPLRRGMLRLNRGLIGPDAAYLPTTNGFDPIAMAAWLNELRASAAGQPHAPGTGAIRREGPGHAHN